MKRQMNRETTDISEILKNNNGDNKMYILTTPRSPEVSNEACKYRALFMVGAKSNITIRLVNRSQYQISKVWFGRVDFL